MNPENKIGFDPKQFEHQYKALPKDILYFPQKPKLMEIWMISSIVMVGHIGLTAYGLPWFSGFAVWGTTWFGLKSVKNSQEKDSPKRRGLLMGRQQISFSDDFGRTTWQSVPHSDDMFLQCNPREKTIDLHYKRKTGQPQTLRLNNMHLGPTLTALENWVNQNKGREIDPTDADRHGLWLNVMSTLQAYRGYLPKSLFESMPNYPYETHSLRRFAEELKAHDGAIQKRDRRVAIGTLLIGLSCLCAMLAIALRGPRTDMAVWATLIFPTGYWIWASLERWKHYKRDKRAPVLMPHFQWAVILITYTFYMTH